MRSVKSAMPKGHRTGINDNNYRQLEYVRKNSHGYRDNAKEFIWDYLSTHPCQICGEAVLSFWSFITLMEKRPKYQGLLVAEHPLTL